MNEVGLLSKEYRSAKHSVLCRKKDCKLFIEIFKLVESTFLGSLFRFRYFEDKKIFRDLFEFITKTNRIFFSSPVRRTF